MDLLERYLQAVGKYLPAKRRDDIVEELRENLLSQMEDKEAETGHPLTADEEETILKRHGHPLLVAVRYFPQRHLIGPTLFPYYWMVLRVALAIALIVNVVLTGVVIGVSNDPAKAVLPAILRLPGVALTVWMWVTLSFAVFEFAGQQFVKNVTPFSSWSPRTLPAVERKPNKRDRAPIADFIFHACFAIYLLIAAYHPYFIIGPGAASFERAHLQISAEVRTFFWLFVGMAFAQALILGAYLLAPSLRRLRRVTDLLFQGLGLGVVILLARVPAYFVADPAASDVTSAQKIAESLNMALHLSFRLAVVVTTINLLWKIYCLITGREGASHGNGARTVTGTAQ